MAERRGKRSFDSHNFGILKRACEIHDICQVNFTIHMIRTLCYFVIKIISLSMKIISCQIKS